MFLGVTVLLRNAAACCPGGMSCIRNVVSLVQSIGLHEISMLTFSS